MIAAIIQARMNSKRLFGKVLKKILYKPVIYYQIERLKRSKQIDKIIIATTKNKLDDQLEIFCKKYNLICFRGDENNVLKRYYDCAKYHRVKHIIRLTGDCPLTEIKLLEKMIKIHITNKYEYTSNNIEPFWPDGFDIEIINFSTLSKLNNIVNLNSDKEHVTTYIKNNLNKFKYKSLKPNKNYSNFRLTLDQYEDFLLISKIFEKLYRKKKYFDFNDIQILFKNDPNMLLLNKNIIRNQGLKISLKNEKK